MSALALRPERPADYGAIRSLTAEAFASVPYSNGEEPAIIDRLRTAGALALSLVAEQEGKVVGHVAFSPAVTSGGGKWYALGPVAVRPRFQGAGIGSMLIRRGLEKLAAEKGARGCVLVGDPGYYARFGFTPAPELAPAGQPAEYYMVKGFVGHWPGDPVDFHAAFHADR